VKASKAIVVRGQTIAMNRAIQLATVVFCSVLIAATQAFAAEAFLVENGQPRAEIIIAENPARSVRLAAHELQSYVQKISGARLSIATKPSDAAAVSVYVGQSPHTDKLGIKADGLQYGAYRIVSGDNYLVLIGDDTDFVPIEPWARKNNDRVSGKLQREWDAITGDQWGVPNGGMYKNRLRLPGDTGKPDGATTAKNEYLELWGYDERGSFNAVGGFLRGLGVRWYLPGEVGEVLPKLKTIALPKLDETVQPDFPVRRFNFRLGTLGPEISLWAMRLGMRDPNDLQVAHGLDNMTHRDEIFAAHPDWFALYGGKRQNQPGQRLNQLCYSNEELFQATVRNARAQLDHYGFDTVSIMPPDGYTSICQCPLCQGKDSPERDNRGYLSDYVWDFVNRVAKEVGKTHPDKKVLCCAYGVYTQPPLKIAKLEPNVQVCIVGGRRPTSNRPEEQAKIRELRAGWVAKTSNPILIFENYPFTDRGWYLPAYVPHTIGAGINATKGISQGEDIWLSVRSDFDRVGIGFNHFQVYFTARMYWGGPQQDVDALLHEYCRLCYGPAEQEMLAFFAFCETNWQQMEKDKATADAALELFAHAQAKAPADSVYARRLALIDDFLKGLRNKSAQLGKQRGVVPKLRLVGDAADIVIDGKLDDAYWQKCPTAATGRLRELQTGGQPIYGTSIKSGWAGNSVYFAIRCDEHPGEKPNIAAAREDDAALWYGDAVEILLETEAHSYYQIAVSPSGAIVDLDRQGKKRDFDWDSQAEVATQIADDHWTVEIRIPVTQDENDPLHQVIGHKPTQSLPWYFNICRQRLRENGAEHSAFSPTGSEGFHDAMKFAHFYAGRSHQFAADPNAADYFTASRAAEALLTQRKYAEAIAAYVALCEGKVTPRQKSTALAQAAAAACRNDDFQQADGLAARIPLEAVKKTTQMLNLLAQRKADELITQFSAEDIRTWPFWQAGEGWHARGRAYAMAKAGKAAEADLTRALEFTSDARLRRSIGLALGNNRETTLKDDSAALAAYQAAIADAEKLGSTDDFTAVQSIARILTRQGKFDEALAALRRADLDNLRGAWRGNLLLSLGETQQAAGRAAEARAVYQSLADDAAAEPRHRQAAAVRLQSLKLNNQ
jgi:hypothetical protein